MRLYSHNHFIDGTVEGTNIHQVDTNPSHDHTFYGNGCQNGWDTSKPYAGGSIVACSSYTNQTYDGEVLSTKSVYSLQAATSGSGAAITTDNTNAPDTFCPLGWQLPYSGTGGDYYNKTKSWVNFFSIYSLTNNRTSANKARSYPISIALGGRYYWGQDAGALFVKDDAGHFWSITLKSNIDAYKANVWLVGDLTPNLGYAKNNGLSIRCDCRISDLKSSPWHPRSLISIMAFHFLKAHFPSVKIMSNYLKNETKYFIFKELLVNFDEAESKYKMENRILMSE